MLQAQEVVFPMAVATVPPDELGLPTRSPTRNAEPGLERLPLRLEAAVPRDGAQMTLRPAASRRSWTLPRFAWRVSTQELVVFTRQLATMIHSGLPLLKSIQVQARQASSPRLREQLEDIVRQLENGATFTRALARHPSTFDRLYVSLIQAAETIGGLDIILLRLSSYLEASLKLQKQIRAAMVYPAAILVVSAVVLALMLLKVVPTFERMFAGFGAVLPPETLFVLQVSQLAQAYLLVGVVGFVGIIGGLVWWHGTPEGCRRIDSFFLRIPFVGELITRIAMARFCRTLGTLLTSGVPLLEGLDICARTAGNRVLEQAILRVREYIVSGGTLADGMIRSPGFPPVLCQMVAVGESTGELDTMLTRVSDYYDEEVENAVGSLVSMLEPLTMAFLGIVIGGLLVAMYMPVFTMSGVIGGNG